MIHHSSLATLKPAIAVATVVCSFLLSLTGAVSAQEPPAPFACTGEAFGVQDLEASLFEIDQITRPFTFRPIADANGNGICDAGEGCNLECHGGILIEVNGMGFRRTDGFLYGAWVDLTAGTNEELVQIDSAGTVRGLGRPDGLPADIGLNGGDVSSDGATLFLTWHADPNLWMVDLSGLPALPLPPVIRQPITGDAGAVLDWAYNPVDGKLYGGDRNGARGSAQVAQLDPVTGQRKDFTVSGLPGNAPTQYGGAWFNAAGDLFLFENGGRIFKIDLGDDLGNPTPAIVESLAGPSSARNDAAACVQNLIGAAKRMTVTSEPGVWPATVRIDLVFDALVDDLFALSADDDLEKVFGSHGVDWIFEGIDSDRAGFHNPTFDGHFDRELVNQLPKQDLAAGERVTVTVEIDLLTLDHVLPETVFCNQILALAEIDEGMIFGDLSTDGLEPDPDNNGSPDERVPSCIELPCLPSIELIKTGSLDKRANGRLDPGDLIRYRFQVTNTGNSTLRDVTIDDPLVPTIRCPGGYPIAELAPRETVTCRGRYPITEADILEGIRCNTATAGGQALCGERVEDQDTHCEQLLTPFCDDDEGDVLIAQDASCQVFSLDEPSLPIPFPGTSSCGPLGFEMNNVGFRRTDGMLYGVEVDLNSYPGTNNGIVKIDSACNVVPLGVPAGPWPATAVNAGDVSYGGDTLYVTLSGVEDLYVVDLVTFTSSRMRIVGPSRNDDFVLDWAFDRFSGLLYGADRQGQVGELDPATGVRIDTPVTFVPGVSAQGFVGADFGGAWFDALGYLYLHANSGRIFKVDLAAMEVVDAWVGRGSERNDAAFCLP